MDGAASQLNARIIAENASKVKLDVSKVPMALSDGVTDATKRKVFIIETELKDALKQVQTQIQIELQAAILCIQTKLKSDHSETLQNATTC